MLRLNPAAATTGTFIRPIRAEGRYSSALPAAAIIRSGARSRRNSIPGDIVNIAPGVKHWHGAAPDSMFSHFAVEVPGENSHSQWCEVISGEEYGKLK